MIVFISNFVSPHIIPLVENIYRRTNGGIVFIETWKMSSERVTLGYDSWRNKPFVVPYNTYDSNRNYYQNLVNQADVVIASLGSIDTALLKHRVDYNKKTFLMSERLFKKGIFKLLDLRFWNLLKFIRSIRNKNFYLLCMGAYVANDYQLCGFPKSKMWKFGYTPDADKKDFESIMSNKSSNELKFLWVGRFIWWKQPIDAIKAFSKLIKSSSLNMSLTIVGGGGLQDRVVKSLKKYNVKGKIRYVGQKSNEEVMELMRESHYLLCTSNRLEGWGAVINEGISAGCIVIANKMMGAAPYLIEDSKTGYLYSGGSRNLYKVLESVTRSGFCVEIARQAYDYIRTDWTSPVAAERLLDLISSLELKEPTTPKVHGICEHV